jgi:hypothetical protein
MDGGGTAILATGPAPIYLLVHRRLMPMFGEAPKLMNIYLFSPALVLLPIVGKILLRTPERSLRREIRTVVYLGYSAGASTSR